MWQVLSGVFLGWSLGSNDASNVFGTAVASRMVQFWTAAVLCSVFVILGAMLEGGAGMETYSNLLGNQTSPNGVSLSVGGLQRCVLFDTLPSVRW